MVELNELRLNNLYYVDNNVVGALLDWTNNGSEQSVFFNGLTGVKDIKDVNPIPLNTSWLKHMGYTKRGKTSWTIHRGPTIVTINDKDEVYYIDDVEAGYPAIDYVHQLQNLYHGMTRMELQYKMPLVEDLVKINSNLAYLKAGLEKINSELQDAMRELNIIPAKNKNEKDAIANDLYERLNNVAGFSKHLLEIVVINLT